MISHDISGSIIRYDQGYVTEPSHPVWYILIRVARRIKLNSDLIEKRKRPFNSSLSKLLERVPILSLNRFLIEAALWANYSYRLRPQLLSHINSTRMISQRSVDDATMRECTNGTHHKRDVIFKHARRCVSNYSVPFEPLPSRQKRR